MHSIGNYNSHYFILLFNLTSFFHLEENAKKKKIKVIVKLKLIVKSKVIVIINKLVMQQSLLINYIVYIIK